MYQAKHKQQFNSFLVVRHPFHRLVSAYRDKLERLHGETVDGDWYYNTRGRKIVSKYRKKALRKFGSDFFSAENNFGTPLAVNGVRVRELPTFWEFVQNVITSMVTAMDEHWKPMSNFCKPCMIRYETIVHFEHLETEVEYLRRYINSSTTDTITPGSSNSSEVKVRNSCLLYTSPSPRDS